MKKYTPYLILLAAIIFGLIFYSVNPYRNRIPSLEFTVGQIADRTIIAPFTFHIYKSEEELEEERQEKFSEINPVYKISDQKNFLIQKRLNSIFQNLSEYYQRKTADSLNNQTKPLPDSDLSKETVKYLSQKENRLSVYNSLSKKIERITNIGIYPQDYDKKFIRLKRQDEIKNYKLKQLYNYREALDKISESKTPRESFFLRDLCEHILTSNIEPDELINTQIRDSIRNQIDPIEKTVLKNEAIIMKNTKVSQEDKNMLNAMLNSKENTRNERQHLNLLLASFAFFFFSFSSLLILQKYLNKSKENLRNIKFTYLFLASLLFILLFTAISKYFFNVPALFTPYVTPIVLISYFGNPLVGLLYSIVQFFMFSFLINWNFDSSTLLMIPSILTLFYIAKGKNRPSFLTTWLFLIIINVLSNITLSLLRLDNLTAFMNHLIHTSSSIVISILIVHSTLPFLQNLLSSENEQRLLELQDFNHPLLKKLAQLAPGTYHHSLNVGTLAEAPAEKIGANPKIVRVASFFHDIGKIENPQIFIENNSNASQLHNKMYPDESSVNIGEYIRKLVALAEK